jgi:transketolase
MPTDRELARKSLVYRRELLRIIKHAGAGHTGGSLSGIDIISVLYNRILGVSPASAADPDRNRYVQSKGHSVEALYVVLADMGFFPRQLLDTLGAGGSHFVGHPTRKRRLPHRRWQVFADNYLPKAHTQKVEVKQCRVAPKPSWSKP